MRHRKVNQQSAQPTIYYDWREGRWIQFFKIGKNVVAPPQKIHSPNIYNVVTLSTYQGACGSFLSFSVSTLIFFFLSMGRFLIGNKPETKCLMGCGCVPICNNAATADVTGASRSLNAATVRNVDGRAPHQILMNQHRN